jgi:dihydroxyacid dehydratase/phosphogluconate dehydratase
VRTGDEIELDIETRRIDLLVEDSELDRRRAAWQPPARAFERGYGRLFLDHVLQADEGCDFDFLRGGAADRLGERDLAAQYARIGHS